MRPPRSEPSARPTGVLQLEALTWVALVRGMVTCLPFSLTRRLVAGLSRRGKASSSSGPDGIAAAVERAGLLVPGGRQCLIRALAAGIMLERHGHPARVCIGVKRKKGRLLKAHAWVEAGGKVLVGGREAGRYTLLSGLPSCAPGDRP